MLSLFQENSTIKTLSSLLWNIIWNIIGTLLLGKAGERRTETECGKGKCGKFYRNVSIHVSDLRWSFLFTEQVMWKDGDLAGASTLFLPG